LPPPPLVEVIFRPSLFGYKTELLHQAQSIISFPLFHKLATNNAVYGYRPCCHFLIGGGSITCNVLTPEFTFVRASQSPTRRYLVPFNDYVINSDISVRHRIEKLTTKLFVVPETTNILASATVKKMSVAYNSSIIAMAAVLPLLNPSKKDV